MTTDREPALVCCLTFEKTGMRHGAGCSRAERVAALVRQAIHNSHDETYNFPQDVEEHVGRVTRHVLRSQPPVTADHTPERLSAEDRETAVSTIEAIAATHPERYVPVSAGVLRALIDERDEQEARVMHVAASADEWWGLYDQELGRADAAERDRDALAAHLADAEARLAAVEALADQICDALMAARIGYYDGLTVEQHLEQILAALHPAPSEQPAQGGDDT